MLWIHTFCLSPQNLLWGEARLSGQAGEADREGREGSLRAGCGLRLCESCCLCCCFDLPGTEHLHALCKTLFRAHTEPPFHKDREQRNLARHLDGTSPRPLRPKVSLTTLITYLPNLFLLLHFLLQRITTFSDYAETWVSSSLFPSLPPLPFSLHAIHKIWLSLPQKYTGVHHSSPPRKFSSHLDFGNGLSKWTPAVSYLHTQFLQFSRAFFLKSCVRPTKTLVTLLLKKEGESVFVTYSM